MLSEWAWHDMIEPAQLIISELATNAMKATVGYYDRADKEADDQDSAMWALTAGGDQSIVLDVYRFADSVVLSVWDCRRTSPKLQEADFEDVGGRGLRLVQDLSAAWGYRWIKTGGKVVYAVLDGREVGRCDADSP
jgi:hypothetical protein